MARSSAGPTTEATEAQDVLIMGSLRIELGQSRVWLRDEPVKLSTAEFRLLEHLAVQADRVVPLQELIQVTHRLQTDYREDSGLLRPLVRSLRRKLGYPAGDMGCIEAVRGVGYRLTTPGDTQEHSAGPSRASGPDQALRSV
jgi:DNA-binding response OmpR family regulator